MISRRSFAWLFVCFGVYSVALFFSSGNNYSNRSEILLNWNKILRIPQDSLQPLFNSLSVDERYACGSELMSMPMYLDGKLIKYGKKFSCDLLWYLNDTQLLGPSTDEVTDFKSEDVVYLTYSSENHFDESKVAILKLRNIGMNKIIYYDIGLTEEQVAELKTVCNLEYRKFDFSRYPQFVQNPMIYSFKSIAIAEVYKDYPVFWFMDTSIHFRNATALESFYRDASSERYGKFIGRFLAGHSTYAATDPGMYDYLPLDENLAKKDMYGAWMFVIRSQFSREAVKWHFLCAITEDCISPEGSKLKCVWTDQDRSNKYGHCHRYDQSAINIILSNLYEKYNEHPPVAGSDFKDLFDLDREARYYEPLHLECEKI